jgi:hypothetical protein
MWGRRKRSAADSEEAAHAILDSYVRNTPSDQNALDIFAGDWMSKLPNGFENLVAGELSLCYDPRVDWALREIGGVVGARVLELGPLEAGHTIQLERSGAGSVLAIESNSRAFLKCLITKEIVDLTRSRFMLGDAVEHLRETDDRYDLIVASGILYHMHNPIELIGRIADHTDCAYIWTHYFDEKIIGRNRQIRGKFPGEAEKLEYGGFEARIHRQYYGEALEESRFCGGGSEHSGWMERDDLFRCLEHFGFDQISTDFDDLDHGNGPCLALVASRTR